MSTDRTHRIHAWIACIVLGVALVAAGSSPAGADPGNGKGFAPVMIVGPLPVPVDVGPGPIQVETVNPPTATAPLQTALSFDEIEDGELGRSFNVAVPDGMRAVVEHVSMGALLPSGQVARASVLCQGGGSGLAEILVPMTLQGSFGGFSYFVGSLPIRCYAEGGSGILGFVGRNSNVGESGKVSFSISARLEELD